MAPLLVRGRWKKPSVAFSVAVDLSWVNFGAQIVEWALPKMASKKMGEKSFIMLDFSKYYPSNWIRQ